MVFGVDKFPFIFELTVFFSLVFAVGDDYAVHVDIDGRIFFVRTGFFDNTEISDGGLSGGNVFKNYIVVVYDFVCLVAHVFVNFSIAVVVFAVVDFFIDATVSIVIYNVAIAELADDDVQCLGLLVLVILGIFGFLGQCAAHAAHGCVLGVFFQVVKALQIAVEHLGHAFGTFFACLEDCVE